MTNEEAMKIGEWFLYKQCDIYCTIRTTEYTENDIWNATNIAFKSLENTDKYRWHDLRKDPNDLPSKDGFYWIHGIWGSGKHQEGECEYKLHDGYFSAAWNFNVIAWKETEPFEVEE